MTHIQAESTDGIVEIDLPSPGQNTPISQIMARDVQCVSPETSVSELNRRFLERGISGMPVVNAEGRPLGVVSKTDILRTLGNGSASLVRDVMTPVTLAMPEAASIARAAALMAYERVHRVIVLGPTGKVVGIVSTIDVLRWLSRREGYSVP